MSKRFISSLSAELGDFLAFKRRLGHPYVRPEHTLKSFDRFVHERAAPKAHLELEELLLEWLSRFQGRKPVSIANELGVLRQFCLFRRRRDPAAFVPGRVWAPQSTRSEFLPHVFSDEQIRVLLAEAQALRGSFRQTTFRALILVLYCTGLRLGEAVRLRLRDVDLHEGVFFVEYSKRKSRFVPFGRDLCVELKHYRRVRRRKAPTSAGSAFFVRPDGRAMTVYIVSCTLRRMLRRLGLKPAKGREGPRPHDLRHTFAVHRLTRWHRAGVDVHARFPLLSTYMGHDDLLGTQVYLTATPELLGIATRRFEARFSRARPRR